MSRDSYEILHEHIHGWLHRKNIASSVRRVSTLPVAIATDIGLVRKENQDRVAILKFRPSSKAKDIVVVALADGMGGMEGGANAASLTLSTFFTEIIRNSHLPIRSCLEKAVLQANDSVLNVYKGNGGATLSAIALEDDDNITAVNVGDSRIYYVSHEETTQLSEDDTLVALAKKYNNHLNMDPQDIDLRFGGELVQFIGIDGTLEIHFHHIQALESGVIILSSDGAHSIGKDNLRKLYVHSANLGVYSRRVIDLASWFGGFDNASIAVIDLFNTLKELDVSSGDVINLWDPFGELKVISVPNKSSSLETLNTVELEKNNKGTSGVRKVSNKKNTDSVVSDINKATTKRKARTKNKNKSLQELDEKKNGLNKNNRLDCISQLDMSFLERNSIKGDGDDE